MIGTDYTPGLLAELAKKSNVRRLEIPVAPKGQRVSSYTKRYTDGLECKTTLFDGGDAELASTVADCGADGSRLGFTLGREVSKVGAVSMIEETHSGVDTITSFFEDETSGEPWLVIVEPD